MTYKFKTEHTSTKPLPYRKLPGHVLVEEFLVPYYPAQLSDLAYRTRIPVRRLQKLIRGQDRIDQGMADRLGRFFGNGADYWLELQTKFERGETL
jgi:addiction module HigA family antidote